MPIGIYGMISVKSFLLSGVIKLRKAKALYNVKYRQMDCIYCGIKHQKLLQDEARNSRHYYEYTVCQYNNFVAKLFNSICQAYELSNQVFQKLRLFTFLVG